MAEILFPNPEKLHKELEAAGLPVVGVCNTGRVDYSRALTKTESSKAKSVVDSYDPKPTTQKLRIKAYSAAGITLEDLVFALWEHLIKSDSTKAAAIQVKMEAIDALIN